MMSNENLPHPAHLLPAVMQAVLSAGALIRAEFHRPGGPRGTHGKCPVDAQVEAELMQALLTLHPCDWHGEELPRRKTGHADCWVVDPQDGTTAFQRGLRGSAVSVALMRQGQSVLGVVFAPCAPDDAGDLFIWAEGMVPMRNGKPMLPIGPRPAPYEPMEGAPWPAKPASPKRYDYATLIALNEQAGDFAAHNHATFAPAGVLAIPSIAYRLALAAAGEVDVAVSLTKGLDSYDIGAGHALLHAVGGMLVQLNGNPVSHGEGRTFHGCIGGRPEIVQAVQERGPTGGSRIKRHPVQPKRRTSAIGPLRWAQGALLGLLVGDALGSQVEFLDPATIWARHPGGLRDLLPGGTWNLLAGQPTDDGELALALARALADAGGFDRDRVAKGYIDWLASGPFDVGATTAEGIHALAGRGKAKSVSQANGALMRVAPIGIAAAGDPAKAASWARQDAALTHPHPVCQAASAAFAAAIAAGVAGANSPAMWADAYAHAGEDAGGAEIRQALLEARDRLPPDFTRNQGWVLTAFGNAFHRLWREQGFAEALTETVMSGGDTDTNAAICGALLGAAYGRDAIPLAWRSQVMGCRAVRGKGVAHSRPISCWADDAAGLAEALLGCQMSVSQQHGGSFASTRNIDEQTGVHRNQSCPSYPDIGFTDALPESDGLFTFTNEDGHSETIDFRAVSNALDTSPSLFEGRTTLGGDEDGSGYIPSRPGTHNEHKEVPSLGRRSTVHDIVVTWANELLDQLERTDAATFGKWLENQCTEMNHLFLGFIRGETRSDYKRSSWNTPQKLGASIRANMHLDIEAQLAVKHAFMITADMIIRSILECKGKPPGFWAQQMDSIVGALIGGLTGAAVKDDGVSR